MAGSNGGAAGAASAADGGLVGLLVEANLPHRAPDALVAWSETTGSIALAVTPSASPGSASGKLGGVAVLDPSCPEDFCELQPALAGPADKLVSLCWSPPVNRHVLVAASQQGCLSVWSQLPHDQQGGPHVLAVNQWYGHTLSTGCLSEADVPSSVPLGGGDHSGAAGTGAGGASGGDSVAGGGAWGAEESGLLPAPTEGLNFLGEPEDMFVRDPEPPPPPKPPEPASASAPPAAAAAVSQPPAPARGALHVVHCGWLWEPAARLWSASALASAPLPPNSLDDLFAAPGPRPPPGQVELRHWLRASLLCLAVVDSWGGLHFWWATLGRHPSQLHWQRSARLALLPTAATPSSSPLASPTTPLARVVAAAAVGAGAGTVRVALVAHTAPSRVQLCAVKGCPPTQARVAPAMLPPEQRLHAVSLATIDLAPSLPAAPPSALSHVGLRLHHGPMGTRVYVLAGPSAPQHDPQQQQQQPRQQQQQQPPSPFAAAQGSGGGGAASGAAAVLLAYDQQGGVGCDGPGAMAPSWPVRADRSFASPEQGLAQGLAVSWEGAKVAVIAGSWVHVLNTESFGVLSSHRVLVPPPSAALAPADANGHAAGSAPPAPAPQPQQTAVGCCFSPLSCALCVLSDGAWTAPADGAQGPAAGGRALSAAQGCSLVVLPVLDVPMGQPHRAIFQAAPWPPAAAGPSPPPHEPLPDPAWEAHARLEAARGVWGALLGLPAWCMARRARAVAAGRAGWAPTLRALSLLDDMLHYEDSHPRPAYCAAADRIKLALLRDVPGAVPGAVKADVAARQIIATLHMMMSASAQSHIVASGSSANDPAHAARVAAEAVALKPWLTWLGEFAQLMLACLRAWSEGLSLAPKLARLPAPHVAAPGVTEQRLALEAAVVAEEEGPGAAWAFWQEAWEAGGLLSPEEAVAALPCLRLLVDRKLLGNLRFCMLLMVQIRNRIPAHVLDDAEERTDEAVQAQHQLQTKMKQFCHAIESLLNLNMPTAEPGQPQQQQQQPAQPSPQDLTRTLRTLYPGRVHLHAGRCTLVAQAAQLQPLFSSPAVMAAPLLTPRQLMARARSLGLFLVPTSPPLWSGAGAPPAPPLAAANGADQHTKLSAWTAFRGRAPSPIEHAPTLLLSGSSDGSGGAGQPDASPAARAERDGDAAGAEGGAAARRRRWRQQRAAALGVAWGPPAAGRAQSRVTEAAVQERAPVLDVLSGARMQPHTAAWSVEAVDGSTATSQFEEDVLAVPAQPQTILMLKRAWLGVCPVAGVPWKRGARGMLVLLLALPRSRSAQAQLAVCFAKRSAAQAASQAAAATTAAEPAPRGIMQQVWAALAQQRAPVPPPARPPLQLSLLMARPQQQLLWHSSSSAAAPAHSWHGPGSRFLVPRCPHRTMASQRSARAAVRLQVLAPPHEAHQQQPHDGSSLALHLARHGLEQPGSWAAPPTSPLPEPPALQQAPHEAAQPLQDAALQQQARERAAAVRVVAVGVDPDSRGAIAVTCWDSPGLDQPVDLSTVQVEVYDMPCSEVTLQKRSKKTGKPLKRRWLDVVAATRLIDSVLDRHVPGHRHAALERQQHQQQPSEGRQALPQAAQEGGEERRGGGGSVAAAPPRVELRAFVESSPTLPFNSSPRTLASQLHSIGAWHGLLAMAGFSACTVPATVWKRDLSLVGLSKEGSVALAHQLWPHRAHTLARKKDHGRAEAMLILAWALGAVREEPPGTNGGSGKPAKQATSSSGGGGNGAGEGGAAAVRRKQAAAGGVPGQQAAAVQGLHAALLTRAGLPATAAALDAAAKRASPPAPAPADEGAAAAAAAAAAGAGGIAAAPQALARGAAEAGSEEGDEDEEEEDEEEEWEEGEEEEQAALAAEERRRLRLEEQARVALLIEERRAWPLRMGLVRSASPTDGYGNPMPTREDLILPVGAPEACRRVATAKPPRQRAAASPGAPAAAAASEGGGAPAAAKRRGRPRSSAAHPALDGSAEAALGGASAPPALGEVAGAEEAGVAQAKRETRGRPRKEVALADGGSEEGGDASPARASPRPRGRPPSAVIARGIAGSNGEETASPEPASPGPRGRPAKAAAPTALAGGSGEEGGDGAGPASPRSRGRPRKAVIDGDDSGEEGGAGHGEEAPRPRGRPRKPRSESDSGTASPASEHGGPGGDALAAS